jgi:tRNA(Arg) A34 adenosine deaminase TadA
MIIKTVPSLEAGMRRCISLAQEAANSGNYALGALVTLDDRIVAESGSSLIGDDNDPSAHPEMVVIREAARQLKSRYLSGAFLITTLEPCPMCTAAAIWAKMSGIAFGATQEDAIAWSAENPDKIYTWRQIHISAEQVVTAGTPHLALRKELLRDECRTLFGLTGSRR